MRTTICTGALAATCDKIEYVEAKDWTAKELETQACMAMTEMANNELLASKASNGHGVLDPVSRMYSDQSTACMVQYDLYVRVLKNVHHKEHQPCN